MSFHVLRFCGVLCFFACFAFCFPSGFRGLPCAGKFVKGLHRAAEAKGVPGPRAAQRRGCGGPSLRPSWLVFGTVSSISLCGTSKSGGFKGSHQQNATFEGEIQRLRQDQDQGWRTLNMKLVLCLCVCVFPHACFILFLWANIVSAEVYLGDLRKLLCFPLEVRRCCFVDCPSFDCFFFSPFPHHCPSLVYKIWPGNNPLSFVLLIGLDPISLFPAGRGSKGQWEAPTGASGLLWRFSRPPCTCWAWLFAAPAPPPLLVGLRPNRTPLSPQLRFAPCLRSPLRPGSQAPRLPRGGRVARGAQLQRPPAPRGAGPGEPRGVLRAPQRQRAQRTRDADGGEGGEAGPGAGSPV